jgi:uncharacterized protein YkwD
MYLRYILLTAIFLAYHGADASTPSAAVSTVPIEARGRPAFFSTTPEGNAALGSGKARSELERAALAVASARTPALIGDGRLAKVALALAHSLDPRSSDLNLAQLASMTREQGLINGLPQVVWASAESLQRSRVLVIERAQPILARDASTHFGVAAEKRGPLWIVVLVLDHRLIELEPIPTALATAGTVRVRARLLENLSDATLVVTRPDGKFEYAARNQRESTLDHTLTLSEGSWGLEILGSGERGPSVVANMVVDVGTSRTPTTLTTSDQSPLTVASFTSGLEALITAERMRQDLPSLTRNASLDSVAAAHSADMREHRFIGHLSPTTGGPSERIVQARVPAWALRENVARGYTPQEVHAFLMGSPAHRASILSADTDQLGLGVIEQYERGRQAFVVTELFARRPFEITADQMLTDILTGAPRNARQPVAKDAKLSDGALAAAKRFFSEPTLPQDALLQTAMNEARRPRGAKTVTARLFVGVLPSSIDLTEQLLDPAVRWIGAGIARGDHPQFGVDTLAIVVFIAK